MVRRAGTIDETPRPPQPPRLRITTDRPPAEWSGRDLGVTGVAVSGAELSGIDTAFAEITGSSLTDVRFAGSHWRNAVLADTALTGCDLANAGFADCGWQRVAVERSRLVGVQLAGCSLRNVTVTDSNANLANLRFTDLQRVAFTGCSLVGSDWGSAQLTDVSFTDCDLTEGAFSNAKMSRVRFVRCRLVRLAGVTGLSGAIIDRGDLLELAETLAATLGIRLSDGDPHQPR
jgi:uncharacterized protein YjbI with pentapeptide repeats